MARKRAERSTKAASQHTKSDLLATAEGDAINGGCTLVSAYFEVGNKYGDDNYTRWFEKTMRIRAPLVFFSDPKHTELVTRLRGDLPTLCVPTTVDELFAYELRDRFRTHPHHCPSQELAVIWHSKVDLIMRAARLAPFDSTHFAWYDAGHCAYRSEAPPRTPWPHPAHLRRLPARRVAVTTSQRFCHRRAILRGAYSHYISGGAFVLHHSYIEEFHAIYYGALRECLKAFPGELFASSDQCVHSFLYARNPARYCVLGHGYGATVPLLYSDGKAPRLRETT